jgi:hypothetical protein
MWAETAHARLRAFRDYVQQYLDCREAYRRRTYTDKQYNEFQALAADLLAALEEIREEAAQEETL